MPWSKPKDKEPFNKDDEYFLRNGGDKYIGWWDNDEKEFYIIEKNAGMTYFEKDQYPNIEWWDEQEPNQDELWKEIERYVSEYSEQINEESQFPEDLKHFLTIRYTLIHK